MESTPEGKDDLFSFFCRIRDVVLDVWLSNGGVAWEDLELVWWDILFEYVIDVCFGDEIIYVPAI